MRTIRILYNQKGTLANTLLANTLVGPVNSVLSSRKSDTRIEVSCEDHASFLEKVGEPKWDIVLMNIGSADRIDHGLVKNIRDRIPAIFVAESAVYPRNETEIKKYFKDYVSYRSDVRAEHMLDVLERHELIPRDVPA